MARSHLTKPPQWDPSILMGKTFLSKGSVCAADELSGLRPGIFPGSRFVVGLNNATAPGAQVAIAPELVLDALTQPWEKREDLDHFHSLALHFAPNSEPHRYPKSLDPQSCLRT